MSADVVMNTGGFGNRRTRFEWAGESPAAAQPSADVQPEGGDEAAWVITAVNLPRVEAPLADDGWPLGA